MSENKSSFWVGFYAGISISFIAISIFLGSTLVSVLKNQGVSAGGNVPQAVVAAPSAAPAAPPAAPSAPAAPGTLVTFNDLKGRPSMGPENALITLVEFSDFHCPFCKRVEPTIDQLMKNYAGKIRKVWRHYPLPFHTGADRTHAASECAHEQGKFWEYHNKLIESQGGARDDAALIKIAEDLKLDKNKFTGCLVSDKYKSVVQADIAKGSQVGVNGTPAVFVNGRLVSGAQPYENFSKIIDGIIDPSKAVPFTAPAAAAPPTPVFATFDDLKGRPSLGPDNAPVTIVQFSDFICPFCSKVEPVMDQLMQNFPGKIRKVWRHYPLKFHVGADHIHEASECAHEQGKFWEYHNKLMAQQGAYKDDPALIGLAETLKLDKNKFQQCLTSGRGKAAVQADMAKGSQIGVRGTPAAFINGEMVGGAQPYANFEALVKKALNKS